MPVHRLASIAACSAAAVALAGAQQPARSPARSQATFDSYTTAILVDVVVRDGKGRPVTDLTAADFELREDGTPQDDRLVHARLARRRHRHRRRAQGAGRRHHDRDAAPARGRHAGDAGPQSERHGAGVRRAVGGGGGSVPAGGPRGAADDPDPQRAGRRLHDLAGGDAAPDLHRRSDARAPGGPPRHGDRAESPAGRRGAAGAPRPPRGAGAPEPERRGADVDRRRRRPGRHVVEHGAGRDGAAPRDRPAPHAAGLRRPRARAARHVHHVRAVHDPADAGRDAGPQDAGAVLGGPAGVAGAGGQPAGGRRGGQPRQHHRLCHRRQRPARGERHCTTRASKSRRRPRSGCGSSRRRATTPTSRSCAWSSAPRT